jgi:hypothetical protein
MRDHGSRQGVTHISLADILCAVLLPAHGDKITD